MYIKYCVRECVQIYILYITHTHTWAVAWAWVGSWNAPARHQRPGHSRQGVGPDLPPCWHSSQPVINCHKDTGGKTSWSTTALLKSSEQMILWTTAGRTRAVSGNFRGPCARKNPHATLKWRTVMVHTLVKSRSSARWDICGMADKPLLYYLTVIMLLHRMLEV